MWIFSMTHSPTRHHPTLAAGSTHRLYLPSLDGARGLAVILVVLDHLASSKIIPFHELRGVGRVGVYLFFALSGFLLFAPFVLKSTEGIARWETWGSYFLRRLLRIYPLYFLALLVSHAINPAFTWRIVADHLLLRRGDGVFWTIEVETQYYLILPVMVWTFIVAWRRGVAAGCLASAGFFICLHLLFRVTARHWSLDGHVLKPYFMIFTFGSAAGALLALVAGHPRWPRWSRFACEGAAFTAFLLCLCAAPSIHGVLPPRLAPGWDAGLVLSGFFSALFIFCHLHGAGWIKACLEWRPLRYLGLISYSVYLWHRPVIDTFWRLTDAAHVPYAAHWPVRTAYVLLACVALSSLSFFLVERPLSRLKAGFTRSL